MKNVCILCVVMLLSTTLFSCSLMYCKKGDAFVLNRSAKKNAGQIVLPVDCGKEREKHNSDSGEQDLKGGDSSCLEPLVIDNQKFIINEAGPEYDPIITDDEGFAVYREPDISTKREGVLSVYRFFWTGRKRHSSLGEAILLRLEFNENGRFLLIKHREFHNCRRGKRNKVNIRIREVSESDWGHFEDIVERNDFWNAPNPAEDLARDGSLWSLEGAKDGKYNVIDQANPSTWNNSVLLEAGEFLMRLAGFGDKV